MSKLKPVFADKAEAERWLAERRAEADAREKEVGKLRFLIELLTEMADLADRLYDPAKAREIQDAWAKQIRMPIGGCPMTVESLINMGAVRAAPEVCSSAQS